MSRRLAPNARWSAVIVLAILVAGAVVLPLAHQFHHEHEHNHLHGAVRHYHESVGHQHEVHEHARHDPHGHHHQHLTTTNDSRRHPPAEHAYGDPQGRPPAQSPLDPDHGVGSPLHHGIALTAAYDYPPPTPDFSPADWIPAARLVQSLIERDKDPAQPRGPPSDAPLEPTF